MANRKPCPRMVSGIGRIPESTWQSVKTVQNQIQSIRFGKKATSRELAQEISNYDLPPAPRVPKRAMGRDGKLKLTEAELSKGYNPVDHLNSPSEILPTMYDGIVGAWRQMELSRAKAYGILDNAVSGLNARETKSILEDLKNNKVPRNANGREIKKLLDDLGAKTQRGTRIDQAGQTVQDLFKELDNRGLKPQLHDVLQRYVAGRLSAHYLNEPLKLLKEVLPHYLMAGHSIRGSTPRNG